MINSGGGGRVITPKEYLTLQNIRECEDVFVKYMADVHSVLLSSDPRVRKVLFRVMNDIAHANPSVGIKPDDIALMDVRQLNNLTLNISRDVFLDDSSSRDKRPGAATKQVAIDLIAREQNTASLRPTANPVVPRPMVSSHLKSDDAVDLKRSFERIMSERGPPQLSMEPPPSSLNGSRDDPIKAEDFAKRVAMIEAVRERDSPAPPSDAKQQQQHQTDAFDRISDALPVPNIGMADAQAIHRAGLADIDTFEEFRRSNLDKRDRLGSDALIQPSTASATNTVTRFVTMAGFDRNWEVDRTRYAYTVGVTGYSEGCLQSSFRNVVSLAATCVVMPMDAVKQPTAANVAGSVYHNTETTFAHPYLLLTIDNMTVNEGTNDAIRRSFCVLKYDNSYRTPNGRGYIVMIPVQQEAKRFQPSPLSSLHNMHISLRKPNGTLYNNARDDYSIVKLEYEVFNRMYVKVVMDKYFDKNEFFVGDTLYFRRCTATLSPSVRGSSHISSLESLLEFLNRPEGHEVAEIGQANDSSFYRTFYILAPGALDQEAGRIEIDTGATSLIQDISADASSQITGSVINASLQMVVSMTVHVAVTDASSVGLTVQGV